MRIDRSNMHRMCAYKLQFVKNEWLCAIILQIDFDKGSVHFCANSQLYLLRWDALETFHCTVSTIQPYHRYFAINIRREICSKMPKMWTKFASSAVGFSLWAFQIAQNQVYSNSNFIFHWTLEWTNQDHELFICQKFIWLLLLLLESDPFKRNRPAKMDRKRDATRILLRYLSAIFLSLPFWCMCGVSVFCCCWRPEMAPMSIQCRKCQPTCSWVWINLTITFANSPENSQSNFFAFYSDNFLHKETTNWIHLLRRIKRWLNESKKQNNHNKTKNNNSNFKYHQPLHFQCTAWHSTL